MERKSKDEMESIAMLEDLREGEKRVPQITLMQMHISCNLKHGCDATINYDDTLSPKS